MSDSKFRWLLVLYILVTLAAAGASYFPSGHSQLLADAYAQEPTPPLYRHVWLASAVGLSLMLATIVSIIGLFWFKRWARTVLLCTVIGGLIFYLFSGPELHSALESRLAELVAILRGAILAIVYFSPIASRLGANNSFKPKPLRGSA